MFTAWHSENRGSELERTGALNRPGGSTGGRLTLKDVTGEALRRWRESQGWDVPRMAREIRKAARDSGEDVAAHHGLVKMIPQWERGSRAPRERYRLLYLKIFQADPGELSRGMGLGMTSRCRSPRSAPARPGCRAPARSGRSKPAPWPSRGAP